MFDGIRIHNRLRTITQAWFWEDMFDAVSDYIRSRSSWVVVGNAGTFLSALAGLVYYWSRPFSFAGYAVVQLACLVCQAVALIPVAWPGHAATLRRIADFSDLHQSVTVATVCGSWIFGVFPGASLLVFFDVDVNSPLWAAVFFSGMALMMACLAGLITATVVSDKVRTQLREASRPPSVSDSGDSGDSADVDSGGFDSD
ncbi:hypothetical protein ACFWU3_06920 [Streptomyces sp. NPDC058685]|uniref:hypothetical protein n=1 Tax=Streptomyces sp. NPDC058685 TaxID=3346598 RepID=UPI003666D423